jgi:hypothetical protein
MSLDDLKRLQRQRLTGQTAQLPPPQKRRSRWLQFLDRIPIFGRRRRRNATMKQIIKQSDGSWDILDDTQTITETIPFEEEKETTRNLPAIPDPIRARPIQQAPPPPPCPEPSVAGLYLTAYVLFALAVGINVYNAWGSNWTNTALPLAMGITAELALFVSVRWWGFSGRGLLALALSVVFLGFAVWNDLRMASIIAADAAMARADRSTAGTERAADAVTKAQAAAVTACGPGLGKSKGCALAQDAVTKAETAAKEARATVAAGANPAAKDFVRFVSWITRGAVVPSGDDFDNWGLLFRMLIPNLGGFFLLLARR